MDAQTFQAMMAQFTEAIQQAVAARQEPPRQRTAKLEWPKYSAAQGEDFAVFERKIRNIQMDGYLGEQQIILGALQGLQGKAATMAMSMSNNIDAYPNGLEGFLTTLRLIFKTPAHASMARTRFDSAMQKPTESIREYHGRLKGIWMDAYQEEEEPWRFTQPIVPPQGRHVADTPGLHSARLMEKFITGIRDTTVRGSVRDSVYMKGPIETYTEALERAMQFQANAERLIIEAKRLKYGANMAERFSETYDQAPATKKKDESEPMELGNIRTEKYCKFHKSTRHDTTECRAAKRQATADSETQPGAKPKTESQWSQRRSQDTTAKDRSASWRCFRCNEKGHGKKQCPLNKGQAKQGVNNIEEETDSGDEGWEEQQYPSEN